MHLAYPKREVWIIIYEFVMTACSEIGNDGNPPPEPPCSEVWSMLSDSDKEDAWILLLEWLDQQDVLEILNELSASDCAAAEGAIWRSQSLAAMRPMEVILCE